MKTNQFDSNDFLSGIKSATGVAIGYLPIGITYGILARTAGLSLFETIAMSLMVFAGASQFVALNLIAMGVNPLQIVFTVFMVNLRHFLMSTSLSEKIGKHKPYLEAVYSFGITDETFAVQNGLDPFSLKRQFGWEQMSTALKYVHMSDKALQESYSNSSPMDNLA